MKKGTAEKPRFYPLVLSDQSLKRQAAHTSNSSVRVILGGYRLTIEIDEHFSPVVLRDEINTLEQL
jgi:hypothetical protein